MDWQFDNNLPIYTQIIYKYRLAIASGELKPGEKLPTVRDAAFQAGVNPNTMQRAFQELERLGLVYTQRSSGRFVTDDMSIIDKTQRILAEECVCRFLRSMSGLGLDRQQVIDMIKNEKENINGNI